MFANGALLVSPAEPVNDFEKSTADKQVQQKDKTTGKPLWSVSVMDLDPDARRGQREVQVKIAADHQPEMPAAIGELVEFDGMTVTPWVDDRGNRARQGYSFRAASVRKAGAAGRAQKDAA